MTISFGTPNNVPVENRPYAVDLADLNGDGNIDAVVTRATDGTVSVLFGDGNGGFAATYDPLSVGSAYSPINVSLIDLDGDGDKDIVTTNFSFPELLAGSPAPSSNYSILLNNGDGTFGAATTNNIPTLPDGTVVSAISVADLDGDGYVDLAAGRLGDNNVYIFPGTGSGFSSTPQSYNIGDTTRDVTVVDINKDGFLDSVLVRSGQSKVVVQLRDGNRNITQEKPFDVGSEPRGVTAADIDGDGNLDLLVANSGNNNVSWLKGNGDGTFQSATNYGAGNGSRAVAAGYIDGNNSLDLVVVNETGNTVSVLLNNTPGDNFIGTSRGDFYIVDNIGDTITESPNGGIDQVNSSVTYTLGDNLENLALTGTNNINGTGNSLNNNITGNSGNNILDGGGGNDNLYGQGGNDTLIGGDGNDSLFGGAGADSLIGGNGNDVYYVDNTRDVVVEAANAGFDIVYSSVSFNLGDNVERLILTGVDDIEGTGNNLNNTIEGNSGINHLFGGDGNDTLYGGGGDDTLVGGNGNDNLFGGAGVNTFRFQNSNEGVDTIWDFDHNIDKIQISASGFGGGLSDGHGVPLDASAFISGSGVTSATSSTHRFIYNTNNGALFFDADGVGGANSIKIATLTGQPALSASDIFVIA